MEIRSVIVALVFGVLMGWGMTRRLDDVRPFRWAATIGVGVGAIVIALSLGDDAGLVGGSLVFGCGSGLAVSLLVRSPRGHADQGYGPAAADEAGQF